jgi:hypothetical protein
VDTFIKIVIVVVLALVIAAAAAAQGWSGSEGNSVVRSGPMAYSDPYSRPGLFFLRRPQAVLAPAYSLAYPFVAIRTEQRGDYVVREFRPSGSPSETVYSARLNTTREARTSAKRLNKVKHTKKESRR